MKKLILLSTIIFAGTTAFGQTAKTSKVQVANETVQSEVAKQKSSDIKAAGKNNPVGKTGSSSSTSNNNKSGSTKPAPIVNTQVKQTIKNTEKNANTGK